MKISDFAKRENISIATIRYYMELGLIIPERKGAYYSFNMECISDANTIAELKEMRFTLDEIKQILSIQRMTKFKNKNANDFFVKILEEKRKKIQEEITKLTITQGKINKKINRLNRTIEYKKTGVPLKMISLLACPTCKKTLSLVNVTIEAEYIMEGDLSCTCGYTSKIREGILHNSKENEEVQGISWYSLLSDFHPDIINNQIKSYRQLLHFLDNSQGKLYFSMDRFAGSFIVENAKKLNKDNLYIILNNSKKVLSHIKERIDELDLGLNILYILSEDSALPIKEKCIDYFIDDFSTSHFLYYHDYYPIEKFNTFLKGDSSIIGAQFFYTKSNLSKNNFNKNFPHGSLEKLSSFKKYEQTLSNYGFKMFFQEKPVPIEDPGGGREFDYHVKGDCIFIYSFIAKRQK